MDSKFIFNQHKYKRKTVGRIKNVKVITWFSIITQIAFPLAGTFTPIVAVAGSSKSLLVNTDERPVMRTQVYTLSSGESIESVAKKYNITIPALRQLNQLRTFAHGFNHLQSGDELDVPSAPLPTVKHNTNMTEVFNDQRRDMQEQKLAGVASQAGNLLSHNPNSDVAASMARGMATGAAGSEIQTWLSRFGTARVLLDIDKDFSLQNSQFDLLIPLYEHKDNLFFTQGSLHRTDDRTQSNLGMGYRLFSDTWMLGGNTFLDYDLSREHTRMGIGIEYWRDFLKLGMNGYQRLTNWKDSPDLTDYEERPANGWDVRAQAWLPALPQLGGKLTYEQYYGHEVGLFGKDNRQHDPHAITAGITYTPVPLVTLSAEQRQGTSGKNDTRFGVDMSYQLGVPWQSQINPDAVAAMRSLVGSRYDLIERNNNIVLEYRKKEVIRLHTVSLVTGYAGEQKPLGVSVTSKYGLERINWSASSLIAAGGKIVQTDADYTVMLPAYQTAAQAVNTYTIHGVAVDKKGNMSKQSKTQVTVQAPEVNKQNSTLTPANSSLPADGKSTQVLTLTLKDEHNQPVDISTSAITLDNGNPKSATVSAPTRKSSGVYNVTVTAGVDIETVTVNLSVQGVALVPASITITSAEPDTGQSQFIVTPETIVADNIVTSTLTLTAKDAQGNAVSGLKEALKFVVKKDGEKSAISAAKDALTLSAVKESAKGVYIATLKGRVAGKYTVIPEYNSTPLGNLSAAVALVADEPVRSMSSITTNQTRYTLGDDMLVTVTLKDSEGNAVSGASTLLTADAVKVENAALKGNWTDNNDGTYSATYLAGTIGTGLRATVWLSGWNAGSSMANRYVITAPVTLVGIIAVGDEYIFKPNAGFPSTGFNGAKIGLLLDNATGSDYSWTADAPWVSVSDGTVTFIGTGTGDKVTITATPKMQGAGKTITYSFTLKSWFIEGSTKPMFWSDADTYCRNQSGYSLATVMQLNGNTKQDKDGYRNGRRGVLGGLWSEWGITNKFDSSSMYWSSEKFEDKWHWGVDLGEGMSAAYGDNIDAIKFLAVCRKAL